MFHKRFGFSSYSYVDEGVNSRAVRPDSIASERGAVLVEWAIVTFGCFIGFFVVLDLGAFLTNYMSLTQIAREATRTLTAVPELKQGTFTDITATEEDRDNCEVMGDADFPCGHWLAHERVRLLASVLFPVGRLVSTDQVSVTSEFIPTGASGGEEDDSVRVQISTRFSGVLLKRIPVRVSYRGPYLYEAS